ncbi:hypothetical protein Nepgr_005379 [Nepenthes gracilis]|uniref:Uncharacterized protein n=1 Tax=Nepenthes gracilis TaxID=150966 RepID=A0AAD3XGC5_NEPGR|nr:hypothetical protein Nepgr_005379 [Nepenthes gracilis]
MLLLQLCCNSWYCCSPVFAFSGFWVSLVATSDLLLGFGGFLLMSLWLVLIADLGLAWRWGFTQLQSAAIYFCSNWLLPVAEALVGVLKIVWLLSRLWCFHCSRHDGWLLCVVSLSMLLQMPEASVEVGVLVMAVALKSTP